MDPVLRWYGHSCFRLDFGEGGSVIFDPYAKGSVPGAELPKKPEADLVFCSHDHADHNAADNACSHLLSPSPVRPPNFLVLLP